MADAPAGEFDGAFFTSVFGISRLGYGDGQRQHNGSEDASRRGSQPEKDDAHQRIVVHVFMESDGVTVGWDIITDQ